MAEFGICSGCGLERRLRTKDGTIRRHGPRDNPCPGVGHPPIERWQPDPAKARPYVSIDPAMRSGQPTLHNTRLTVEAVTDLVWDGVPVDQVAHDHDITRPDVLVACWYQGTYGDRTWRKRWVDWADEVAGALWSSRYDVPNPPDRHVEG